TFFTSGCFKYEFTSAVSFIATVAIIGEPCPPTLTIRSNKGLVPVAKSKESCPASDKRESISDRGSFLTTSSVFTSTTFFKTSLASKRKLATSGYLNVSQNSSCAVVCNNSFTRSTSFAPGSSTKIRPEVPRRCILGCVTPNLSTRSRKTSKAETIDSLIFLLMMGFTSLLDIWKLISSPNALLEKISGDDNFVVHPDAFSKASKNRSEEHTSELQSRENHVCSLLL